MPDIDGDLQSGSGVDVPPPPPTDGLASVVRVDFQKRNKPVPPLSAEKLKTFTSLIQAGMVMVTVDARRKDVLVPERFAGDAQLNLNFSHRFGAGDFAYDNVGVRSTLTFGGRPFAVDLPWEAVWAMRSHVREPDRVHVWHTSLPEELVEMLPASAREQLERSRLRNRPEDDAPVAVADDKRDTVEISASGEYEVAAVEAVTEIDAPVGEPEAPSPARGRPALRLIK